MSRRSAARWSLVGSAISRGAEFACTSGSCSARERILERQRLHARFIAEADRNLLTVAAGDAKSIGNMMPLFALQAEVWLLSSPSVQETAKRMCDLALSANAAEKDHAEGDSFAAKTAFVKAARAELSVLEAGVCKGGP